jgi:polyferredoxin
MPATAASATAYAARRFEHEAPAVDLLRWPIIGHLLRWRWIRTAFQIPLFLLAFVIVLHGLYGPDLAPKNLATVVTWVHYRGLLVLVLLAAGNLFCFACPFLLPRELARWIFRPVWNWPRRLRNKWPALVLFVAILFGYEQFALWENPQWTAWLIIGYFSAALIVDALFKHASFCKWVCPIGQFNFIASTLSPLEVRVREPNVCSACGTKDCIRGRVEPSVKGSGRQELPLVSHRGCELALFQPMKVGNLDCTFCLDCVHACPHDNVGVVSRLPGAELWAETSRSGLGRLDVRRDFAALVLVFTFGALLNAFAMTSPMYILAEWFSALTGIKQSWPILSALFVAGLILEPVLLLVPAAALTRRATGNRQSVLALITRYALSLVPLGFGIWLAHYSFHFLTGALTVIPVTESALAEQGWELVKQPDWNMAGMRVSAVYPLEIGFVLLGIIASCVVAVRLARKDCPHGPWRAYLPWIVLHALLGVSAIWLLSQPMEMRGTFLRG